jgi:hypothetical protein
MRIYTTLLLILLLMAFPVKAECEWTEAERLNGDADGTLYYEVATQPDTPELNICHCEPMVFDIFVRDLFDDSAILEVLCDGEHIAETLPYKFSNEMAIAECTCYGEGEGEWEGYIFIVLMINLPDPIQEYTHRDWFQFEFVN